MAETKVLKSCDECKSRKVRCSSYPGPCKGCVKRKLQCHFSRKKIPRRSNANSNLTENPEPIAKPPGEPLVAETPKYSLPELYVDHLLAKAREPGLKDAKPFSVKKNGLFVGNCSITFFSDSRLQYLSTQLGNNKVSELIKRVSTVVQSRVRRHDVLTPGSLRQTRETRTSSVSASEANRYIKLYFERVHPLYPFLDQKVFEETSYGPELSYVLARNKAWSALYHAVLALGCQVDGGGSLVPGKGRDWRLFSTSLVMLPDLISLPDSLTVLHAMASMTVYALSISCIAIEHVILSEAARRAQNMARTGVPAHISGTYHRTFWVLYMIEKISSFLFGRNSVFVDEDIVVPVPLVPESISNFDWFLPVAKFSRLLSRTMTSLFSVGVTGNPKSYYLMVIDQLSVELEQLRLSIPAHIRPGEGIRPPPSPNPLLRRVLVWTEFLYNSFRMCLSRSMLQIAASSTGVVSAAQQAESTRIMMQTSRCILERTIYIEVEPYTPLWILGPVPVMALFVLFDLVISNPKHPETGSNLALLDVAGGHFSRVEYFSNCSLPGSLIAEFAHIAREYVNGVNSGTLAGVQASDAEHPAPSSTRPNPSTNVDVMPPAILPQMEAMGPSVSDANVIETQPSMDMMELTDHLQPRSPDRCEHAHTQNLSQMSMFAPEVQDMSLVEPLFFPVGSAPEGDEIPMGTDIMHLFNSFIPGVEPFDSSQFMDDGSMNPS